MTQVDASIPLQVQVPTPQNPLDQASKAYTLKSQMQQSEMGGLQLEQAKKGVVADQKIKDIFQQPDAFIQDENGQRMLSPGAIQKVFAVDPAKGMALQASHLEQVNATLKMKHMVTQMDGEKLGQAEKHLKLVGDAALGARDSYMSYLKDAPGDVAGATEVSRNAYATQLQGLVKQGLMKPEEADAELKNFSPAQISMKAMTSGHYLATIAEERKARQEKAKEIHDDKMMELRERGEDRRAGALAAAVSARNSKEGALEPEDLSAMAKQYLAGDKSVFQNLGRGAQGSRNVVNLRKAIRAEMNEAGMTPSQVATKLAEFEGLKAGERTLGNRTANVEMAVNEATQFIDVAKAQSDKLGRTRFMPINKALQAFEKNTGDPDVVAFGAANNSLINAYARAVSPSGTPTVHDKEHARDMISTAQSKEQYDAVLKVMQQEMAAAKKSPGMVRESFREGATGKSEGGGDIAAKVKASGVSYEPEKYDYRLAPDGSVQRKPK